MAQTGSVDIGIIDGVGHRLDLQEAVDYEVRTPYGSTSTPVRVGLLGGRRVATIVRRGLDDALQAHLVPYRANIWALASLGVTSLITTSPAGGLRDSFAPGMFVVTDQLIDRTSDRPFTFYDEGVTVELAAAHPFDPTLRGLATEALAGKQIRYRDFGTAVVINGPRFSTQAESRWYAAAGADIVGRTLLPETILAMELGMGVVNVSFITGSDTGETGNPSEAGSEFVRRRIMAVSPTLDRTLAEIVRTIPTGFRPTTTVAADAIAGVLAREPQQMLLVTGGAGFIGGAVVRAALARGTAVRVLDSLRRDVHPDGATATAPEGVEIVIGDVADPAVVAAALAGVDVVCHQAAKVGLGVDFADAPDYVRTNDLGTAVLLAAMTAATIDRLVLASSMVVYGEGAYASSRGPVAVPPRRVEDLEAGRFEPIDPETGEALIPRLVTEDAAIDPRNVYAATKAQQEALASIWARETGGRVAALRYHNVYGPGMPRDTPYAGVAALFRSQLEHGAAPTVLEDGRQRRDFVHVDDIAAANLAAIDWTAEQPRGAVRAFNVGSGVVHTIGDLAAALSAARGGPAPVVTGGYRLGDVRHITASSERLRAELAVPPPVPFEAGVRAFAHAPLRG